MENLYARLLIVSQKSNIKLSEVFQHELSPVPSALFDEYGDMRGGSKSILIQRLAVFTTTPFVPVDHELVDGNEAIYHTLWPSNTKLKTFAGKFVNSFSRSHNIYIIFDQYNKHSIKYHERQRRAKGATPKRYVLDDNTELPARDDIMKSEANKSALIHYICNNYKHSTKLNLIGGQDCTNGHEEADVKIISYLRQLLPTSSHIQILADDTDIFVLLVFFVWLYKPAANVSMRKYDGRIIDINATSAKLGDKCLDLLVVHAISGCDTVSYPFGKGKVSAINTMLKMDIDLKAFANPEATELEWMQAGLNFLSLIYCGKIVESLSDLRFDIFSRKTETPKIKTLPPTNEAAMQHIRRARLQVLIWRSADQPSPPQLNISLFGWKIEHDIPVPVYGNGEFAPKALLELVACGCKSTTPCSRSNCSCRVAGLSCTTYCKCKGSDHCANDYTQTDNSTLESDEEDEVVTI